MKQQCIVAAKIVESSDALCGNFQREALREREGWFDHDHAERDGDHDHHGHGHGHSRFDGSHGHDDREDHGHDGHGHVHDPYDAVVLCSGTAPGM